jgi:hypothetical protein
MKQNNSIMVATFGLCKGLFLSASLFALSVTSAYADCPEIHLENGNWVTTDGWKISDLKGEPDAKIGWRLWQARIISKNKDINVDKIEGTLHECQYVGKSEFKDSLRLTPPKNTLVSFQRTDLEPNPAEKNPDEIQGKWFKLPQRYSSTGHDYGCHGFNKASTLSKPCKFEITNDSVNKVRNNPYGR